MAVTHGDEAYRLAYQRLAQVHQLSFPLDLAICTNPPHGCLRAIFDLTDPRWVVALGWFIDTSRWVLIVGLMRSFLVVLFAKPIELFLLSAEGRFWWVDRFQFESGMHPFVTPVLFRMPRCYPLRDYSQLDPPYRKSGEASECGRCKRGSVVRADCCRKAVLPEDTLHDGSHRGAILTPHSLTTQQLTGVGIRDGKWITADPILGTEPPFEVDAPGLIGSGALCERLGPRCRTPHPFTRSHESVTTQDISCGGRRRQLSFRMAPLEPGRQLARSPGGMLKFRSDQERNDIRACGVRMPKWRTGTVAESCGTVFPVTVYPLASGTSAHAKMSAHLAKRTLPLKVCHYKLHSFVQHTGILPGHSSPPQKKMNVPHYNWYPCARSVLVTMCPVRTQRQPSPEMGEGARASQGSAGGRRLRVGGRD